MKRRNKEKTESKEKMLYFWITMLDYVNQRNQHKTQTILRLNPMQQHSVQWVK